MRFSIQLGGFGKYSAEVGGQTITIHRNLPSVFTFPAIWRWTWVDGECMLLRYHRRGVLSYGWDVIAGGETVCSRELYGSHWVWEYDLIVAWFHREGCKHVKFPDRPWYKKKSEPSFGDALTTLRRLSCRDPFRGYLPNTGRLKTQVARLIEFVSLAG